MTRADHFIPRHFFTAFLTLLLLVPLASAQTRMRLMASNLTTSNASTYNDEATHIFQALDPDVVMMQEFKVGGNTTPEFNAYVSSAFSPTYQWFRESQSGGIPNGIISRWPILTSGEWEDPDVSDRDFAWAQIDIPGSVNLWAVSVHLLTAGSSERNSQATMLRTFIQNFVPAGDYLVIAGDFNTDGTGEACLSTLSSVITVPVARPADHQGNSNTNANRNKPYDWVLVDSDLQALHTPLLVGSSTYTNGLVFDSRIYTPLSEVAPVEFDDSDATNMQHMGVLRDFMLPASGGSDFSVAPTSVAYGTVDATSGPFNNSTVTLTVTNPFTLSSVAFNGVHASEFSLISPTLPANITTNASLTFRWSPAANDGVARSSTAQFATTGSPAAFNVSLTGTTSVPPSNGQPLDITGYRLEQRNGAVTLNIPATTILQPGAFLVIGRASTQAQFESAWGTLPVGTTYLNGTAVIGANGFPVINGMEDYRLLLPSLNPADPPSGYLPTAAITTGNSYERTSTGASTFTTRAQALATPGVFGGTRAQTGNLVITEVSDASAFANEFVELLYDSAPVPVELSVFSAD